MKSHGSYEHRQGRQPPSTTTMTMRLVSIAVEGKSKASLWCTSDARVADTLSYSLEAMTASMAEMQRSLVSLTNAVTSTASRQALMGDVSPTPNRSRHHHESTSMTSLSTTSVAPIQVIRNMNYWITGRRPDGKEKTVRDDPPTLLLGTLSEGRYIRA